MIIEMSLSLCFNYLVLINKQLIMFYCGMNVYRQLYLGMFGEEEKILRWGMGGWLMKISFLEMFIFPPQRGAGATIPPVPLLLPKYVVLISHVGLAMVVKTSHCHCFYYFF